MNLPGGGEANEKVEHMPSASLRKKKAVFKKMREFVCEALSESELKLSAERVESYSQMSGDEREESLMALGMQM